MRPRCACLGSHDGPKKSWEISGSLAKRKAARTGTRWLCQRWQLDNNKKSYAEQTGFESWHRGRIKRRSHIRMRSGTQEFRQCGSKSDQSHPRKESISFAHAKASRYAVQGGRDRLQCRIGGKTMGHNVPSRRLTPETRNQTLISRWRDTLLLSSRGGRPPVSRRCKTTSRGRRDVRASKNDLIVSQVRNGGKRSLYCKAYLSKFQIQIRISGHDVERSWASVGVSSPVRRHAAPT